MASKGPKSGTALPAAPKAAPRPRKPGAPKAMIADAGAEKPAPMIEAAVVEPTPFIEPVPAPEAAAQEAVSAPAVFAHATPDGAVVETVEQTTDTITEAVAAPVAAPEPVIEAAAPAAPTANKEATIMETIENNVNVNAHKAQAFFADMNDRTKAAVEKSTKLVEEANEFAKGNLEAVVESSRIAAKGMEAFGQEAAEYSRRSFESATAALKSLAAVKSPTEFFKLQSDFVRGAFDSYVAEASKNTEAMIKLAGDAAQPLSNRVAVAVEKAKIAA